jgi:hypothetical protein
MQQDLDGMRVEIDHNKGTMGKFFPNNGRFRGLSNDTDFPSYRIAASRSIVIKANVPGSTGALPLPPEGTAPNFAETTNTR